MKFKDIFTNFEDFKTSMERYGASFETPDLIKENFFNFIYDNYAEKDFRYKYVDKIKSKTFIYWNNLTTKWLNLINENKKNLTDLIINYENKDTSSGQGDTVLTDANLKKFFLMGSNSEITPNMLSGILTLQRVKNIYSEIDNEFKNLFLNVNYTKETEDCYIGDDVILKTANIGATDILEERGEKQYNINLALWNAIETAGGLTPEQKEILDSFLISGEEPNKILEVLKDLKITKKLLFLLGVKIYEDTFGLKINFPIGKEFRILSSEAENTYFVVNPTTSIFFTDVILTDKVLSGISDISSSSDPKTAVNKNSMQIAFSNFTFKDNNTKIKDLDIFIDVNKNVWFKNDNQNYIILIKDLISHRILIEKDLQFNKPTNEIRHLFLGNLDNYIKMTNDDKLELWKNNEKHISYENDKTVFKKEVDLDNNNLKNVKSALVGSDGINKTDLDNAIANIPTPSVQEEYFTIKFRFDTYNGNIVNVVDLSVIENTTSVSGLTVERDGGELRIFDNNNKTNLFNWNDNFDFEIKMEVGESKNAMLFIYFQPNREIWNGNSWILNSEYVRGSENQSGTGNYGFSSINVFGTNNAIKSVAPRYQNSTNPAIFSAISLFKQLSSSFFKHWSSSGTLINSKIGNDKFIMSSDNRGMTNIVPTFQMLDNLKIISSINRYHSLNGVKQYSSWNISFKTSSNDRTNISGDFFDFNIGGGDNMDDNYITIKFIKK